MCFPLEMFAYLIIFQTQVFHDGKEPYGDMSAKEVRKYVLAGNTLENESEHYPQHMWSITMVGLTHCTDNSS